MKKNLFYVLGLSLAITTVMVGITSFPPTQGQVSAQQDRGWKVWVKTSPCSGRFDWVTVAKENPTGRGGSGYWDEASLIITGAMRCVRNINETCTKAEAEAEAVIVRAQPKFSAYCCKEYSVWSNPQTGKMTIVVGKFGNPGPGWLFEDGPMCCEEAEELSGIKGTCSGGTRGGGTGFGPMTGSTLTGTNLTFYRGTTAEQCQADCGANPQCKGFTLIKAGAYSPNDPPMCYLASAVTGSNNSSCCISGVKGGGGGGKTEPTGGFDLSGNWAGIFTNSEGCKSRWDMVLKRAGANEWQGTTVIIPITCGPTETAKFPTPRPSPVKITSLGNGKLQFSHTGYNYEATYDANQIVWQNIRFAKK